MIRNGKKIIGHFFKCLGLFFFTFERSFYRSVLGIFRSSSSGSYSSLINVEHSGALQWNKCKL